MKSLIHYIAGAVVCTGIAVAVLVFKIKPRRGSLEYGTAEQIFGWFILAVGIGYAVFAIRELLALQEDRPRRRRRRR